MHRLVREGLIVIRKRGLTEKGRAKIKCEPTNNEPKLMKQVRVNRNINDPQNLRWTKETYEPKFEKNKNSGEQIGWAVITINQKMKFTRWKET